MTTPEPAQSEVAPYAFRSFGVYSGRYDDDGQARVYDNGASMATPIVEHAPWLFLDLVSGGCVVTSNVSLYLRIYADGHATYLGPSDRFRAMPPTAANRWNDHARKYGLPEIKPSLRSVERPRPVQEAPEWTI